MSLCDPVDRSTPGFPVHHQLPELAQIHVHQVSDAIKPLRLFCPLLLLPSIFPRITVFSNESVLYKVVKVFEFQLQQQFFQWLFGLISFRIEWFDLLVVQGTLKSLLQYHS